MTSHLSTRMVVAVAVCALSLLGSLTSSTLGGVSAMGLDPLAHRHGALNHVHAGSSSKANRQRSDDEISVQWLNQTLDHEDLASQATFLQRFYVNDAYFNPASPLVFFNLGGEGPIDPGYVDGWWFSSPLAQKFGAMQVTLEHRFYGQSVPTDTSIGQLKFLSSSQALADAVVFHAHIERMYNMTTPAKWITWGGSYSGALSAWARLKYPNLFHGAYATSAPLQAQADFTQYLEVVADGLGAECSSQIADAVTTITQMLSTSPVQLQQDFNLCAPLSSPQDESLFMSSISGPISGTVQYNNENAQFNIPQVSSP